MKLRERTEACTRDTAGGGGEGPDPAELDGLQRRGNELLGAADAAIERALSGDSQKFLEATRQEGGQ